uniref:G-protein coupled receptors family 2 profile 2 domain-containing protein n=1 Tax=Strigamia maritima TaxID=126957 RepID=T1JBA7_STRMM
HIRQTDKFVDIPFVVCQKPKGSRSPRKAELVLTHTPTTKDKYPIIELICHGINVRPNSRTVWYHNGDPYPELERMDPNLEDYLAAARVELVEARQGDYWCEAWDNNAQSTVSSNKITLIVQGVKNCVILLNTTNSHIRDVSEFSRFNNYFNQAESNIVKREATLLADGQIVIWVQEDTARTLEEVVTDVKSQFEAHLEADKLNLEPTVRSTEWCLQETTTDNENTLTWPQTRRNQASLPKEQCFTDNGNAVSRDCLGDFRQGAYWGRVRGSCTGKPNEFTGKLYELSESEVRKDNVLEASIELDQLTDSKKTKNYRPVDIAYIAKTMQKISDTENVANEEMSMESVSCTYWDSRLNIGKGDWSTAGCRLRSIEKNRIICECTHLTNFAVLMDIYEQADRVSGTHRHILDAITYFGCAFSILGLSLTILTFLLFSKWRKKDGNKIICNLALALLLLLIVFLAGIEQTHSPTICLTVAILLHYFILSSFCWMLVEAIQQYLLFVRVLATYIPRFLLKAMVFAWGLPLIIVVTVIGIDINQYREGHHYCWMKQDALYVSFLLPVGIIMIINAVVFILVLRGITCGRTSNLRSNQSKQQLMKTQLYAAICIFVLLGLTWVFGFLAVEKVRVTFQICGAHYAPPKRQKGWEQHQDFRLTLEEKKRICRKTVLLNL